MALVLFASCEKETEPQQVSLQLPDPEPVEDPGQPDFHDLPATENIIMYEINPRAFSPSGDLAGMSARLDHLSSLSVNVIWVMPVHPIGRLRSKNSPYSIRDYRAINSEYGDLETFKSFVDSAHARGMAVIMDWVANHTAWDHPWISQHPEWYSQNSAGQIIHPPGTDWYDVADLNFDQPAMRRAMREAMKFWLISAKVDGFRCDYADGVPFDFWQNTIDSLRASVERDLLFLAEGARPDHFQAGFDLAFGWQYYGTMKAVFNNSQPASALLNAHRNEYLAAGPQQHRLRFTTNHDETAWDATPVQIFNGLDGALAASVVTIFQGGVPLIYTGQEVGQPTQVPFFSRAPIDWQQNPEFLAAYRDILAYYNQSAPARRGDLSWYSTPGVVCFTRQAGNEELLVIANLSGTPLNFYPPSALRAPWQNVLSGQKVSLANVVTLPGYQFWILEPV